MPSAIATRNSFPASYRLAWGLWICCGAIYLIAYFFLADLSGDRAHGLLLASTLLLQAILVPAYVWRAKFASRLEAAIRGASAGVALAGLTVTLFLLTETLFHFPKNLAESESLQLNFVSTILVLAGLAGGTQLGILRWTILERASLAVRETALDSWWRRYVNSAVLWIASVTACCWLVNALVWISSDSFVVNLVFFGIFVGIPGLFLAAPIPVAFPAEASASRGKRIWKYSCISLLVLIAIWVLATLVSLAGQSLLAVYLIVSFPYLLALWVPCLLWAVLSGLAELPITQQTPAPPPRPASASPQPTSSLKLVALSLVFQSCAFLAGLRTTAPVSLGWHGVGCMTAYSTSAAEYWFWQAYKGIGSRSESSDRIIFRPAVDSTTCVVINQKELVSLQDPREITLGYAEAARTWYWLVDPDEWDSARTKQIRQELFRLLGREFSSFAELQEWWEQSNQNLFWSGTDEKLEVREPSVQDLAHSYTYRQQHFATSLSAVENIRLHPYVLEPQSPSGKVEDHIGSLRGALPDREARLQGLKLAASDSIDVLTGERDRAAREYLQRTFGSQFATAVEWRNFFARQGYPPAPWRMSRASAQEMTALIRVYGDTEPYRGRYVEKLREETGLNYSTPEEFIPWLQDPENTRGEDWLKARDLADHLVDEANPTVAPRFAISTLKRVTNQSFDSPQDWIQWWQSNHTSLVLSADGRRLVVGR